MQEHRVTDIRMYLAGIFRGSYIILPTNQRNVITHEIGGNDLVVLNDVIFDGAVEVL
jgi:hypothetical protein